LFAFIDFHAHATKKGIFFFGNSLPNNDQQVDNLLLPKLVSLNCINFDFLECNFSDEIMTKVDKKGESWEGSGWVDIYKATGIIHCYTLECNYHSGKWLNHIPSKTNVLTRH